MAMLARVLAHLLNEHDPAVEHRIDRPAGVAGWLQVVPHQSLSIEDPGIAFAADHDLSRIGTLALGALRSDDLLVEITVTAALAIRHRERSTTVKDRNDWRSRSRRDNSSGSGARGTGIASPRSKRSVM